jgi:hypothetical protein
LFYRWKRILFLLVDFRGVYFGVVYFISWECCSVKLSKICSENSNFVCINLNFSSSIPPVT